MSHVLVVGSIPSATTEQLIQHLTAQGHTYAVLSDIRTVKELPDQHWYRCDFSSKDKLLATLAGLKVKPQTTLTLYENYVLPSAWICDYFGIPGMTETAALQCTDKLLMRQALRSAPQSISPDFAEVRSGQDLEAFAQTHSFPLVLKPANLVKSLLVSKCHTLEELHAAYQYTEAALAAAYRTYAPDRRPRLLVEEYLQGSMHTVVGFAGSDGFAHPVKEITDITRAEDINKTDNYLFARTLPSQLDDQQQKAVLECARQGMEALGMRNTPAHVEIILTGDGPKIVEIGARLGGYRRRMYQAAYGYDLLGAAVTAALGKPPVLRGTLRESCTVVEIFPDAPGIFKELVGDQQVKKLESYKAITLKAAPGDRVGPAKDGYKCCAVITLQCADNATLLRDLQTVYKRVRAALKED